MSRETIMRPALRYHGGKWKLRQWIISHFPPHGHYVEPFGGGASVLIAKRPAPLETYNDLDSHVVCFFRVLRERPGELIDQIRLTPWSREEMLLSSEPVPAHHPDPDLERARRLFVSCSMGRGRTVAASGEASGWRYEIVPYRIRRAYDDAIHLDHLEAIARRLKRVQIEHDDALRVIERFDGAGTLFYLDPPYPAETRSSRWGKNAYRHEMSTLDHARMLSRLRDIQGMAVISGYPSALYERMLERYGWTRFSRLVATDGRGRSMPRRTECIWLNPAAMAGRAQQELF